MNFSSHVPVPMHAWRGSRTRSPTRAWELKLVMKESCMETLRECEEYFFCVGHTKRFFMACSWSQTAAVDVPGGLGELGGVDLGGLSSPKSGVGFIQIWEAAGGFVPIWEAAGGFVPIWEAAGPDLG